MSLKGFLHDIYLLCFFRIVQIIASILLPDEKDNIINKKRFMDEFSGGEISMSQKASRPDDFKHTFSGNIDDNFKLGLKVTKKSLKVWFVLISSIFFYCNVYLNFEFR